MSQWASRVLGCAQLYQAENSGITEGAFIKRHALPKAGGGTLKWTDFVVGSDINVYGRVFRITGADDFTRVRRFD
jgi:EF-hand domain-containing protein 1